jgi:hypothetical protein
VIITPSERRKADRFEALVTGRAQADESDAAPFALASRLQSVDTGGQVDPVFRDRLRTRLLAVATVQGIGGDADARPTRSQRHLHRQPERRLPRRLALAGGTMAALVALSGVGAASGDAVPGDALYSVKRSREAAQLALARSDVSRGQLHLQFARTRLAEAASVQGNENELRRVLDDMDADTRTGMRHLSSAAVERQDRAPLDAVDDFIAVQRRELLSLIAVLPDKRRMRAVDSLGLLEQISDRSTALRPSLLCTVGYTGANRSDELGPLPRRCAALPGVEPGGSNVPGGPDTSTGRPKSSATPGVVPGSSASVGTSASPSAGPLSGQDPGSPNGPEPTEGPGAEPSPTPSGGTQGLLGSVTDTIGGVLGGLLGGLGNGPR